ncbi:MAG: dehydrogenase E1 component subunit alpha/beta [Myxococcota bacterium]|nr:dehydrogenase E1 component subunit alpha/beta [Myxococcota bacterium]
MTLDPSRAKNSRALDLYRTLLLPRVIEERMLILLRQGRLSKWFSGIGQEAVAVGATWALESDDYILPLHRNLGVFTTRDVALDRLFQQLLGRQGGFTGGRDRSFHFGLWSHSIVGMISHLGAMCPVACGLALAAQMNGSQKIALVFLGDGASSEGDVHEAMNLAATWRLPVIFVVENNQYALSTPTQEQYACSGLHQRAIGYGMPGFVVDGNCVHTVIEAVSSAAARARAGQGPTMLECMTFRMRGHEEASGTAYVPDELRAQWMELDPIARLERALMDDDVLFPTLRNTIRQSLEEQVDSVVLKQLEAPAAHSSPQNELTDVYRYSPPPATVPTVSGPQTRYVDAIRDALINQMERDDSTILMGQDIAEYGGVFKVTDGLNRRFGSKRVRNTPIIESGAVGCAMGLALTGAKPMVEIQFADFISCAFNQIVHNLAPTHYRWGAPVPVVIRAPFGGGVGAGPFHSQCVESWFASTPGLKIVAPSNAYDAKGLLLAAFSDPNPVLFLEHKKLYRTNVTPVPEGAYELEIGRGHVVRSGLDMTVVSYGWAVHWADAAADRFSQQGYEIEVIDLRTIKPWDENLVFESVKKTGRVLVLHEAQVSGGFGGEVAARISDVCFEWLDAPVRRLGSLDTPVPFAQALETQFLPINKLDKEIHALLMY